jgi:hypothetical protein
MPDVAGLFWVVWGIKKGKPEDPNESLFWPNLLVLVLIDCLLSVNIK